MTFEFVTHVVLTCLAAATAGVIMYVCVLSRAAIFYVAAALACLLASVIGAMSLVEFGNYYAVGGSLLYPAVFTLIVCCEAQHGREESLRVQKAVAFGVMVYLLTHLRWLIPPYTSIDVVNPPAPEQVRVTAACLGAFYVMSCYSLIVRDRLQATAFVPRFLLIHIPIAVLTTPLITWATLTMPQFAVYDYWTVMLNTMLYRIVFVVVLLLPAYISYRKLDSSRNTSSYISQGA